MRVRFIKGWQFYRVGQIIEPPGLLREWLLQSKYVEVVRDEPEIETAMVGPPEHAALRIDPPRRKRGRPRTIPV